MKKTEDRKYLTEWKTDACISERGWIFYVSFRSPGEFISTWKIYIGQNLEFTGGVRSKRSDIFQRICCNFFATAFFAPTVSVCTPSIRTTKHSRTIWIFNANFIALYIFLLNEMCDVMFFGAWINLFTSLRRSFWTLFNIEFKTQFTL